MHLYRISITFPYGESRAGPGTYDFFISFDRISAPKDRNVHPLLNKFKSTTSGSNPDFLKERHFRDLKTEFLAHRENIYR